MKGVWGTMFLRQGFGGLEPSAPCGRNSEAERLERKGALAQLFRFPDEAPNVPHREAIKENTVRERSET